MSVSTLPQRDLLDPSPETTCIHGTSRRGKDAATGAILTPIFQSTTYVQPSLGVDRGYTYSRSSNPTVTALEEHLAALESVRFARCFSTGMAAITSLFLSLLKQGDHVIVSDVVYGGTVRVLKQIFASLGIESSFVDLADAENLDDFLRDETKLVLIETPANPTLKLVDIAAIAERLQSHEALLAVDSTFLTPILQKPLELGADIAVYSTTKFIDGHNATVGGALITDDEDLDQQFDFIRNATGCIQSPFEAWLTLQGLKTLPLRIREHSRNALEIAKWLEQQPEIGKVIYPGLESFSQKEIAERQQGAGGGLIAFEVAGDDEQVRSFLQNVRLCSLAENLGSTETLLTHPATMTHADVPQEQREKCGITNQLIRLSVGLENTTDLIHDLEQALK